MIIERNPNFVGKKLERFAKIFRESLNLLFTFLEIFWAGKLVSENNSNFLKESDFEQKNILVCRNCILCVQTNTWRKFVSRKNFFRVFVDLSRNFVITVVENACNTSQKSLSNEIFLKIFQLYIIVRFWMKNEKTLGNEFSVGLTKLPFTCPVDHFEKFLRKSLILEKARSSSAKKSDVLQKNFHDMLKMYLASLEKIWEEEFISWNTRSI